MGLRDEHVERLVEEKVAEFASILSPAQLAELCGILREACDVYPEVRQLVDKHAPREHADKSGVKHKGAGDGAPTSDRRPSRFPNPQQLLDELAQGLADVASLGGNWTAVWQLFPALSGGSEAREPRSGALRRQRGTAA